MATCHGQPASYKATLAPSGSGRPPRGPPPRDIIAHTQTPAAPGAAATASYRAQRWDAAIEAFESAVALNPRDKAATLYVARCQTLKETPPGGDWDGVFVMETK